MRHSGEGRRTGFGLGRAGAALAMALGAGGLAAASLPQGTAGAATSTPPAIYVSNANGRTVTSYPLPSTGDLAPTITISSTSFDYSEGEAFDGSGDLWVSNYSAGTVTEFTPAQLAAGGTLVVPSVTIHSAGNPVGIAFDRAGDLWVAGQNSNALTEFTPAQLATSGSPTPNVTVSASGGSIDSPQGIAFGGSGDLWVTNFDGNSLTAFTPAQLAATGSPTPAVTVTSPSFNKPIGVAFDNSGDAWVSNFGVYTLVELTPAQLAGTGSPTAVVTLADDGSGTSLTAPGQLEFDSTGQLWVANLVDSISGFSPAQLAASGAPVPTDKINGASTDLVQPAGLALADPPQAPTNAAVTVSGTTATVTWTAPIARVYATDYQVTPIINGVAQATIDSHSASTTFSFPVPAGSTVAFKVTASNVFGIGPAATSNTTTVAPGYWEVASDGGLFSFGNVQFYGSMGGKPLNKPIVGMAATPDGAGYWEVATDGGIFSFGDATFYGSTGSIALNKPIVGMASTPDGKGYWLVASDGGIFAYGDAAFYGSTGSIALNKPIVGMAATPDGKGYWLVASDGGIFSFGDAAFYGSTGSIALNKPIVGMAATPDGKGYWLVASDGGLFSYGDAAYDGSMGGKPLNEPIVGMLATPDGAGYWEVASDGGLFTFGDAAFLGSMGGKPLNKPIVGMA